MPDPIKFAVGQPWRLLGIVALALALCAVGARELSFDPRYGTFFADDDPQLEDFEHLRGVFAPSDAVAFVVEVSTEQETIEGGAASDDVFSGAGGAAVAALTEAGWRLPFALRVDSYANFPHAWNFCEHPDDLVCDGVEIAPLNAFAEASASAGPDPAVLRAVARATPELSGRLVDRAGQHAMVVVTVLPKGDPLASTQRLIGEARALAARVEAEAVGVRVHVGGIVAMNHAFSESSLTDSARLMPVMFALMFLGLAWLLGGWRPMAAVVVVLVTSIVMTLGLAGWAGLVLTTPTAIAPIIIATVAIADCVHVVLGQHGAGVTGDARARLRASLEENRGPVLLTSLTTAAGFASMNFSAVPPFRDLGNVVAVGALLAGALSLTLLPALLRVLAADDGRGPRVPTARVATLVDGVLARRRALLALTVLALAVVLPGAGRLSVNDDFVAYFDTSLPFRRAAELTDAHLGGMYEIEYQLQAVDGSVHAPEFLEEVAAFTAWLRAQPETGHVLSWADVLARIGRAMEPERGGALPRDSATASQYTLLYELSLPLGQDLTNMVAPDHGSVRQLVSLRGVDSRRVIDFEARAEAWLANNAPAIAERHGGINLMFAHVSERNVEAMFEGNLLAVAVIAAVLALALRSVLLAGVSLVTNLVPVFAAFGLWGWFSGELGLALSTCFGMTLGIVVDDTVHLLARYRRRRRGGDDRHGAVREALIGVGPALVVTSAILAVGFSVLATSTFAINASLARMTLLTVVLALLFDLLALPALLAGGRRDSIPADDRPAERR